MFERFTEKAIKVIMLAQEEARRLGHNFVGTEQILLGLIGEGTGVAAKAATASALARLPSRIAVSGGRSPRSIQRSMTPSSAKVESPRTSSMDMR